MHRLDKFAFYVGDRLQGPTTRRRRSKPNSLSAKRRKAYGRVQLIVRDE